MEHSRFKMVVGRAVMRLGLPDSVRFLLFGINNRDKHLYLKTKKHKDRPGRQERLSLALKKQDNKKSAEEIADLIKIWLSDESNYLKDFSLSDLSKSIGVSQRSLSRYFELHSETDFRSWKSELKIAKAKNLLLDQYDMDIAAVANAVGFKDRSNFHKQFKMLCGCTPGQWRDTNGHPEILDD